MTPTDRYAKRPDSFPAKNRIEFVSKDNSNSYLIDDSIQSFEPALPPIEEEPEAPIQEKEEKPVVYEEMSLFDDILNFEDDKKE